MLDDSLGASQTLGAFQAIPSARHQCLPSVRLKLAGAASFVTQKDADLDSTSTKNLTTKSPLPPSLSFPNSNFAQCVTRTGFSRRKVAEKQTSKH